MWLDDQLIENKLHGEEKKKISYTLCPPNFSETIIKIRVFLPEIYRVGSADTLQFNLAGESSDEVEDNEDTSTNADSTTINNKDTTGATSTSADSSISNVDNNSTNSNITDEDTDSSTDSKDYHAIKLSKITSEEEKKKRGNRNLWGDNEKQESEDDSNNNDNNDNDTKKDNDNSNNESDEETPIYNVTSDSDILTMNDPKRIIDFDNEIIDLSFDKDYEEANGTATFHVPYNQINNLNLKRGARIIIQEGYKYPNRTEDIKMVFSGYIDEVSTNESKIEVKCKDLGELLNTQIEVEYNQQSRQDIMEDIIENKIGLKADIDFFELYNDIIDFSTVSKNKDDDDSGGFDGTVSADVKKAAKQICGSSKGKKALKKIFNWVSTHVHYEGYTNTRNTLSETLKGKSANCCDEAHLCCALANAVGIKTRYINGTAAFLDGTYGHVWAQYYVGGSWFTMDTVSNCTTHQLTNKGWGSCAGRVISQSIVGATLGF